MFKFIFRSKRIFVVAAVMMLTAISCGGTGGNKTSEIGTSEVIESIDPDTKVIYVDNQHPDSSNNNPGTADLPFKTISAAAVKADDLKKASVPTTVLIHPGTYRESIKLPIRDIKSDVKIVFQGTEKGKVIISGSDIWTDWVKQPGSNIYTHNWPYDWGTVRNPWTSYDQKLDEIVRRREMIFVNGELLKQVLNHNELEENSFFVSETENKAYIWPSRDTDISKSIVEVAVRSGLFIVRTRSNLEIRGLVFQHDNSGVDDKAVQIHSSKNTIVEDCYFVWNNWGGLVFFDSQNITVRRNVANYNGAKGMEAWKIKGLLFEDNETSYNNWRGVRGGFTGFAVAGLKHLRIHDGVYRNHTSMGNLTRGFWLDFDNTNILIENAIWKGNLKDAIFIEANEGPITIKDSAICNNKDGRGAIIGGHSENVTLEGNVIYNNGNAQINIGGSNSRKSENWETGESFTLDSKDWIIENNLIAGNGSEQLLLYRYGTNTFLDNFKSNNNIWINTADEVFRISRKDYTDFEGWRLATDQDLDSQFENFMPALTTKHKELLDICLEEESTPTPVAYTPSQNGSIKILFYKALSKLRNQLSIH